MTAAAPGAPPLPDAGRDRHLSRDLTVIILVGVLVVGASIGVLAWVFRTGYGPSAFVQQYLQTLASGHAADALAVPGVAVESADLRAASLPDNASDALLRSATLSSLTDIAIVSEEPGADGIVDVTVSYTAGQQAGTTTFHVTRDGTIGVMPAWKFSTSPLAVMDLTVNGSTEFTVNGFRIDKRQIGGTDVDLTAPVPMLVFSPGLYSVDVATTIAQSPGVAVLSDVPMMNIPVTVDAEATPQFTTVITQRVNEFLDSCATQEVLQPTGCPFGYFIEDRIDGLPKWSIASYPKITVVPDGADWRLPSVKATAHLEVDVRSVFDGSISHLSTDVPFLVSGVITLQPDGTASIRVTGSGD